MFARYILFAYVWGHMMTVAVAERFTLTDLGSLPQGASGISGTAAYGINNLGQVVGTTFGHPFLWQHGQITPLFGPNETGAALDINDSGQIVGRHGNEASYGYVYSNGIVTNVTVGLSNGTATAINNSGYVVGSANFGNGIEAYYFDGVSTVGLSYSGLPASAALDINNVNQIVGHYSENGETQPFLFDLDNHEPDPFPMNYGTAFAVNDAGQVVVYSDSNRAIVVNGITTEDIGTLGGANSLPLAINSNGDVVGVSLTANGRDHAFLYMNDVMYDLSGSEPCGGWEFLSANDINDQGWIVGVGVLADDVSTQRGILLRPITEALPGDANNDDRVDLADLNLVRNHFGESGPGDTNGDGSVDLDDLNAVRNNFGGLVCTATASITSIPEPGSLLLIAVGTASAVAFRRYSRLI